MTSPEPTLTEVLAELGAMEAAGTPADYDKARRIAETIATTIVALGDYSPEAPKLYGRALSGRDRLAADHSYRVVRNFVARAEDLMTKSNVTLTQAFALVATGANPPEVVERPAAARGCVVKAIGSSSIGSLR